MKISLDEIKEMFDNLIAEKISREQVSNWASERGNRDRFAARTLS